MAWRSGVNQGAERVKKTERDLTGESELRMLVRPLLYRVTRSSGVEEEIGVRVAIQEERESLLMSLMLRNEITRGVLEMERRRVTLNERREWSVKQS